MPYIRGEDRVELLDALESVNPDSPGELNYVISKLIDRYVEVPSYHNYNEVIGVLECVKQEYYRRVISTFEDKKLKMNGEVFSVSEAISERSDA